MPKEIKGGGNYGFTDHERSLLKNIGQITLELRIFDLDKEYMRIAVKDRAGLKSLLKENGGLRVYRGGVRVFGLGGSGEDWLDLGARRVLKPDTRLSNNQILGAVLLDHGPSDVLREQTNRRGFVEDQTYSVLKKALLEAILQIEAERFKDKKRLRALFSTSQVKIPVIDDLKNLRETIHELGSGVEEKLKSTVDRIERSYTETRDMLVAAAGTGLGLAGIVHDVEKQVNTLLKEARRANPSIEVIRNMTENLAEMMDGMTFLLRKSSKKTESMNSIVVTALRTYNHRFQSHEIEIVNGFESNADFYVICVRRMVLGTILNLLDNAIWWLNISGEKKKRIYVGPSRDLGDKPALVIADNGPGFTDDPETLVKPLFSRKSDGMGLGLYLADQGSNIQGGRLEFPSPGDVALPDKFSGAVIAIILPPGGNDA